MPAKFSGTPFWPSSNLERPSVTRNFGSPLPLAPNLMSDSPRADDDKPPSRRVAIAFGGAHQHPIPGDIPSGRHLKRTSLGRWPYSHHYMWAGHQMGHFPGESSKMALSTYIHSAKSQFCLATTKAALALSADQAQQQGGSDRQWYRLGNLNGCRYLWAALEQPSELL